MFRSWREVRDARRKGRRDGRAGVPGSEQDALPFDLLEILARAQGRAERVLARWRVRDQELASELDDLTHRAADAEARLADDEERLGAAASEHQRLTQEEEQRVARLQARLEDVAVADPTAFEFDEPEMPDVLPIAGGAPSRLESVPSTPEPATVVADASWRGIGSFVYWSLIGLIVIGEIPLNAFAFRLFHEPDVLTYAMTFTVAVGLVLMAHGVGLLVARPERTKVERVLVAVFVALPVAAVAVISLVRYDYLVDVGGDAGIGPVLGTLAFGVINLLVFGAAAGLSYLRHDPRTLVNRRASSRESERERTRTERRREDEQQRQAERERRAIDEQQRRELDRLKEIHEVGLEARRGEAAARREHVAESMRVIREAQRERLQRLAALRVEVDAARAAFGEAQRAVQAAGSERRALRDATDAELRAIRARRDLLAFTYGSANVRARADHDAPACLREMPPLDLPAEFADTIGSPA